MNPTGAGGAWEHWYHLTCHTYGTWLPGDDRGFRTRQHGLHVDGDYKRPPPRGKYAGLHRHAKASMSRPAVYLDEEQQARAVAEVVASLRKWRVPLVVLSIDRSHLHAIIQAVDGDPRHWLGLAKKECSAYMRRDGLAPAGGLWAAACGVKPIADRDHYHRAVAYVADHAEQGAVVHLDGLPGFDPEDLTFD
jgi:hypothetical protein